MASLYTPAPQREGLDWLAGLVRSGQALAQRERQIQLQKQQQQIQMEHFWSEQARLKGQQDFQNRKFLYEVGHDQRQEMRQGLLDDRAQQNVVRDDLRADKYNAAAVGNLQASAAQTREENKYLYGASFTEPDLPAGEGGISEAGNDLLGTAEGRTNRGALYETREAEPVIVEKGGVKWTKLPNSKGGYYYQQVTPPTQKVEVDALDKEILGHTKDLIALDRGINMLPAAPVGVEPGSEQWKAYEKRVEQINKSNTLIQSQVDYSNERLLDAQTRKRMTTAKFKLENMTPAFEEVAPEFTKALNDKDPQALRAIRPKIEALAQAGDASAIQALKQMDALLGGTAPASKQTEQKAPRSTFNLP